MVGLAKDRVTSSDEGSQHKGERVFLPGRDDPIALPPRSAECHLLARIRDEAHRFAITYHRKMRGKLVSDLDDIDGIGPKRRRDLLRSFGSIAALRGKTAEEIAARIPSFPIGLAQRVADALPAAVAPLEGAPQDGDAGALKPGDGTSGGST